MVCRICVHILCSLYKVVKYGSLSQCVCMCVWLWYDACQLFVSQRIEKVTTEGCLTLQLPPLSPALDRFHELIINTCIIRHFILIIYFIYIFIMLILKLLYLGLPPFMSVSCIHSQYIYTTRVHMLSAIFSWCLIFNIIIIRVVFKGNKIGLFLFWSIRRK